MRLMDNPHHCLIVGPSWVGDMVMAQSLFIVLKQRYPELKIDVLAPAWSQGLLACMPEVNKAITMPLQHGELGLKKRYRLGKSLRANAYDWAIVLPNSFKAALVPWWAKIVRRTGYVGEMRHGLLNDVRHLNTKYLPMTVQRFVALAYEPAAEDNQVQFVQFVQNYPLPDLQIAVELIEQSCQRLALNTDKSILALCPGAEFGESKCWPAEYYAALAQQYIKQGWQVWLLGSENDQAITRSIQQGINHKNCYELAGKTSLAEVTALLSLAQLVLSNDSGLMHIAAATGVPVVGIYGSTDPKHTPPLGIAATTLSLQLDCSPCFQRSCPKGHTHCLWHLSPEQVYTFSSHHLARLS